MQTYHEFTEPVTASFTPKALTKSNSQQYADYQWHLRRIAAIEDTMFTLGLIEEIAESRGGQKSADESRVTQT